MIYTTQKRQRSFDNSWCALYENLGSVPSGLILDLQVTLPEYAEVYLTSLFILDRNTVRITLRKRTNNEMSLISSASISVTGFPAALECEYGMTANVLLGTVSDELTGELINNPVKINPELVSIVGRATEIPSQRLTIHQDGDEVFDDRLSEDVILLSGDQLSYVCAANKASVSLTNPDIPAEAVITKSPIRQIKTINGVRGPTVTLEIVTTKGELPKISIDNNVVSIDSSALRDYLQVEDPIDSRIGPTIGRDFTYYPLDDAYITVEDDKYTLSYPRDVSSGIPGVFTYTENAIKWQSDITYVDDNYDLVETEGQ